MTSPNWFIDLRAHSHGGPVGTLKLTDGAGKFRDLADLIQKVRGRDVLLMTHGFENNRQQGTDALNEWKSHLSIQPEPFYIGVLWPGDCFLPIFIDYIWEGSEAMKSGTLLGQFVDTYFTAAASVSFGSHSLGIRVMLQAILQLTHIPAVQNLFVLAGAIEDDTLAAEFLAAAAKVRRISVIYSYQDRVLELAYPAGNLLGGLIERDDPNVKSALGRSGADPAPANVLMNSPLPAAWNYGHTDYLNSDTHIAGDFAQPVRIPSPQEPPDLSQVPPEAPTPSGLTDTSKWKASWSADLATTRLQPPN